MTSTALVTDLFSDLNKNIKTQLDGLATYPESVWFWKKIVQNELIRFLEFATETTLIATAQNLLYAYTYSGTMEGLIRLAKGLFGDLSVVTVEDEEPGVVSINIQNANTYFLYALSSGEYALAIENRFAMATSDLSAVVNYDPYQFFRNFMTPGRVLKNLTIDIT